MSFPHISRETHKTLDYAASLLLTPVCWSGRVVKQLFTSEEPICYKVTQLFLAVAFAGVSVTFGLIGGALKLSINLLPNNNQMESIEANIETLISEPQSKIKTKHIRDQIKQFEKTNPHEKEKIKSWLQLLEAVEQSAQAWKRERKYRAYEKKKDFRMDDKSVVHVPDDGNCAYHAAAAALKTMSYLIEHTDLRTSVFTWLKENQKNPQVASYLEVALFDFNESLNQKYKENVSTYKLMIEEGSLTIERYNTLIANENEELNSRKLPHIDAYLDQIPQKGFWAGLPELFAIGMLYKIQIKVNNTSNETINLHLGQFTQNGSITLVYDWKPGGQGSHYNVQM